MATEKYDGHSFNMCEEHAKCPHHKTQAPPADACCTEPQVRGGMCFNCGEYFETGSDIPQGDNEG